jgi:hypothetical protein
LGILPTQAGDSLVGFAILKLRGLPESVRVGASTEPRGLRANTVMPLWGRAASAEAGRLAMYFIILRFRFRFIPLCAAIVV